MRRDSLLLHVLAFIAASLPLVQPAFGQPLNQYDSGVAVGPMKLTADVVPGQTWRGTFRMAGRGEGSSSTFELQVLDLAQDMSGQKRAVERGQGARSAADWVDLVDKVTLAPGEGRDIGVTIRVPADAIGAYSAYVVVRLERAKPTAQFAAVIVPTVNVEILVRCRSRGPLEIVAEAVRAYDAGPGGPSGVSVDVANTGVWPAEITGDVLLYPEGGGFPHRLELPYRADGRAYELYPGQKMRLNCRSDARPAPGDYRVVTRIYLGERRESRSEFSLSLGGSRDRSEDGQAERRLELGTDLWVEEPIREIDAPPGSSRSVVVRVQNLGDKPVRVRADVEDARLEEDGRWTYSASESHVPGLTVSLSPDTLVVQPGANAAVRAEVELLNGAVLESSVVKAVRFRGRSGHAAGKGLEGIYDTGALIVIQPTTAAAAVVEVTGLELVRAAPDRNPGSAILTLANRGTGVGEVQGTLSLQRETGELLAEMSIGKDAWERVLPGRERKFRMALPPVDEGVFLVIAELARNQEAGGELRAEARFASVASVPEGMR